MVVHGIWRYTQGYMNNTAAKYRNGILHGLYRTVLKPFFFHNDPETVHDHLVRIGSKLGRSSIGKSLTAGFFDYQDPRLSQCILGIDFKNPVGLSAGFDKNAELTDILPSVGFGFAEVGSITGAKCDGNPKPRLWRLPKSKGLVVYYGLKNDGCEAIAAKLAGKTFAIPIGISVAMTNCIENTVIEKGVEDFAKAFATMEPFSSYITVNISCPNTTGGQPFIIPENLEQLLTRLDTIPTSRPIFIKLSPDMSHPQLDAILDGARAHRIAGIICTNLTKPRDNPAILDTEIPSKGGISGKATQDLADAMLSYIYQREGERFVIIGCGGIFTAEDAYKKIRSGASLVQLITGMIFEGPQLISEINRGLAVLLERDGFKNIAEAVGIDSRTHHE